MDINTNDKFVACWGYDQTQYSIYNVVAVKGNFVFVEGLNSWSNFGESHLAVGSTVKVYEFKHWDKLSTADQTDLMSRGFDWNSYNHHYRKDAEEAAEVRTIVKMGRIDGESWSYLWELDNGQIVNSKEIYANNTSIKIINGLKKCRVNRKYSEPSIRIDECITAYLDPEYDRKHEAYEDQNAYTAYNGR